MIDDLQFFAGKRRTLEELLHTIDTLAAEGRQLVLASDRGLAELRALGPELVSRLAGGLICEIEPPEFATRLGIVRRLGDEAGLAIDDDVLTLVATQITAGARELRGALHRLAGDERGVRRADHARAGRAGARRPGAAQHADGAAGRRAEGRVRRVRRRAGAVAVGSQGPLAQRAADAGDVAGAEVHAGAVERDRPVLRPAQSQHGDLGPSPRGEADRRRRAQVGLADQSCHVEEAIRRLETALRTA